MLGDGSGVIPLNRRFFSWKGLTCLAWMVAGCDYSSYQRPSTPTHTWDSGPSSGSGAAPSENPSAGADSSSLTGTEERDQKKVILDNVMNLIRTAALQPGG